MGVDDLDLIGESFEGLGTSAVVSDFRTSHRQAPVAPELKPDTTGPVEGDGRYPCSWCDRASVRWAVAREYRQKSPSVSRVYTPNETRMKSRSICA